MTTTTATASDVRLEDRLRDVAKTWSRSQYQLVVLAAEFAESFEWMLDGSPTAAHWLSTVVDVEASTAREWIRIGRALPGLPLISAAFESGQISYSKVRTLTRFATADNEADLLAIAVDVTASDLGRALAVWFNRNNDPEDVDALHHRLRSVKWRVEPDGMTTFTLRLPPLLAGMLIAVLTTIVMRSKPVRTVDDASAATSAWPSLAQQHADAVETLLSNDAGTIDTEVVVHVRGGGCELDDGTPITDSKVATLIPKSLIRALIHDVDGKPVNATGPRRHPNTRQKRVVENATSGLRPQRAPRIRPRPRLRRDPPDPHRRTEAALRALSPHPPQSRVDTQDCSMLSPDTLLCLPIPTG